MKIIAGTVTTERDIAAESDFLNVPWQIVDTIEETDTTTAEVILLEGVQAFPLMTTADEVATFLSKKLTTYKENVALHEGAKELQAGLDNSAQVAGEISNLEVTE